MMNEMFGRLIYVIHSKPCVKPTKVVFDKPHTIMYFDDGTKICVKSSGKDRYNKKVGMMYCMAKKFLGEGAVTLMERLYENGSEVKR